jgi:coenzyme F420-reducing hydrogenase delta subunit/NAD-dependent dihydropyrimidine dehydrogenase PreA subunit
LATGEVLTQPRDDVLTPLDELPGGTIEKIRERPRVKVDLTSPEARVRDFAEIEPSYTEREARAEAQRCLACASGAFVEEERCAGCLTCVRICPFGVATVDKTAVMPEEQCQACGLCAAECPAAAIALKRFGADRMRSELVELVANTTKGDGRAPVLVSFCCLFEVTSRPFLRQWDSKRPDQTVVPVMVPCVGRLSVPDMLLPFELGAEGVAVIGCADGECLYPTAEERLGERVAKVKEVLGEIGLSAERIDLWQTQESAEVSWTAFWEISRRKLAALAEGEVEHAT